MGSSAKIRISKHDWLSAQQCLGLAWHTFRAEPTAPDEAGRFRMQQGQEVGTLARKLYPTGVLVPPSDGAAASAATQELIGQSRETIFEAAFIAGPFVARADILRRTNG